MYYAEFNTDKYIRENFFPDFNYKGTMVEVGAGPPVFYSMSKHFRDNNWRCICIDPNPKFVNMHSELQNEIYQYACSNFNGTASFKIVSSGWGENEDGISYSSLDMKYPIGGRSYTEISVSVIELNNLLDDLKIEKLDFLSIDVEGNEIEVMKGFNVEKFQPKVILLENYLHETSYTDYMNSLDYELHHKIDYNYIYKNKKQ